jgi:phosphatidylinositol glycan class S
VLDVYHNPARSVDSATLAPFIATEIRKVFENNKDSITYLLKDSPFASEVLGPLSPQARLALDAKATRAFKYAPTYHLTFSLFTTSASPSAWNIEQAIKDSIAPLLDRLSSISKFTIDSQVQLYASFSPSIAGPQYDSSTREWKLQRSDLSGFVNAAEWPLNPSIGSGPTLNFVLFVPSKEQSPLVLAETGGNSWVIPQWGGVQILNPSGKQTELLTAEDLQPVMLTFADQLTSLLGLPQSPPSLALRIAALTRERATSLILSASSTLGALSRLTLKLTSIAIPDTVAKSVDETIHRLTEACHDIKEGRYEKALTNARIAEGEAEHAFFEPSMVGQVYFPEEHKVAVYVPLLGPMAVPLVMAAIKELKKLKEKKAKTA